MGSAPPEKPRRDDKVLIEFTEDELLAYENNAQRWMEDIDGLRDDAIQEILVQAQQLSKLVRNPPKGRPGLLAMLRAMPLYKEHVAAALGALVKRQQDAEARKLPSLTTGSMHEARLVGTAGGNGKALGSAGRAGPPGAEACPGR